MAMREFYRHVEAINQRLEKTYNKVGGSFFFYWPADLDDYVLSRHYTGHFFPTLRDAVPTLVDYFHEQMVDYVGPSPYGLNLWSCGHPEEIVHMAPPSRMVDRTRLSVEIRQQSKLLRKLLRQLNETGVPYIFYYKPRDVLGANGTARHNKIVVVSPAAPGMALRRSPQWNNIFNPARLQPIPGEEVIPARRCRVTSHAPPATTASAPTQREVDDVAMEDVLGDDELFGGGMDFEEDEMSTLYHALVISAKIRAQVVYKDQGRVDVVVADFVNSEADKTSSLKPVLVGSYPFLVLLYILASFQHITRLD